MACLKKEGLLLPLGEMKTLGGENQGVEAAPQTSLSVIIHSKIILVFNSISSFKCFLKRSNRLCELLTVNKNTCKNHL